MGEIAASSPLMVPHVVLGTACVCGTTCGTMMTPQPEEPIMAEVARNTHGRRIINVDLTEGELASVRSMLSDRSITEVYIRTEEYDGVPPGLVDRADGRRLDRQRL